MKDTNMVPYSGEMYESPNDERNLGITLHINMLARRSAQKVTSYGAILILGCYSSAILDKRVN